MSEAIGREKTIFFLKELTNQIIAAAIEVHRHLGPGLLESAYEECFCHELSLRRLLFERQRPLPLEYKGIQLDCGYRIDLLIANLVIVELKCVEKIIPVHEAQLLTYLRLAGVKVGLIMNFHEPKLTNGIRRMVL
ncbi:GxxExxY protein [Desulfuromonas soudanensis]|uniref:GxxExxY protein n=1 Tax=Desulfuromonas soudanensis TaxID=1603606 RepID=A0A0M5IZF2_9BACT|nr:GxxExxY protein [Desulfuromonas soudanensis]ALC17244.1 GxxExxY protein [Desulfuromonas soudanensis]